MTTKYNTKHDIMKTKTEVNCLKISKETSSCSTRFFQGKFPTTSVNISTF